MGLFVGTLIATALAAAPPAAGEREVAIAGPEGALSGMFRSAGPSAPVVVIIPGSGPTDRDGNNPLGVKASTYKLLAEALGERGVSSLRIDKRGQFASKAAVADGNKVTIADYADDVRKWAAEAKRLAGTRCAWVAGHSEGALVALAAAQKPENLCGVIAIAAPGRPVGTVMGEQLRANPANASILDEAFGALNALEAGQSVETSRLAAPLQPLFNAAVQPYLRDLLSYDPAKLAKAFKGPLMIVHGARDLQVSMADARALQAARPDARLHIAADANHVLKAAPGDRAANLASYADPSLPLAPGIADAVAAFILPGGR